MKQFLTLLILNVFFVASAQTKLVSRHLELKKQKGYYQILNAVNKETNDVYVFASDRDNINIQKYNSALFFSDSLYLKRPDKEYSTMAGYGFQQGKTFIYWTTDDLKKIFSVSYDLENKTEKTTALELTYKDEKILASFNENNAFYILCKITDQEKLKLYTFKGEKPEETIFDFSTFDFTDQKNSKLTMSEILAESPLQKLETDSWNSLVTATAKTKLYISGNKMIMSFDYLAVQTQIFEMDLATSKVTEQLFAQPSLNKPGVSNSFWHNNNVYQLKANDEELAFEIKDYVSGTILKTENVTNNDTIAFKSTPLYSQTGNQQPAVIKNTKKFLNRLSDSDLSLSAYQLNGNLLVTLGGTRNVATTGAIILGATMIGAEIVVGGNGSFSGELFDNDRLQVTYFDCLFDGKLNPVKDKPEPLAMDFITGFLNDHEEISLNNTFRFKDFYILGYYDAEAKQYVMRKFEDGFADSNLPFFK